MSDTPEQKEGGFLAVIERAVMNPEIDVDKLSKLLDVQERWQAKQAEMDFNAAMARLQPKLPYIPKRAGIKNKSGQIQSWYAKYEEVDRLVRPLYVEEGFSLDFDTNGSKYYVTVSHVSGHKKRHELELPKDSSGNKNDVQAVVATVSYARRILLCMAFNIITMDEDDDGHSAVDKEWTTKRAKQLKEAMIAAKEIKVIDDIWNLNSDDLTMIKDKSKAAYDHLDKIYLEYRKKLEKNNENS